MELFTSKNGMSRQTVLMRLGVVVLFTIAVLGACTLKKPAPQGEPLNWATVVADANLAESVYAIGVEVAGVGFAEEDAAVDPGRLGFAAHYPDTIWTNAHVAEAVREAMGIVVDDTGNVAVTAVPVAVRSGTAIGGTHTHRLNMDTVRIHPEYGREALHSPDLAVFRLDDGSFRDVPSFLPRDLASGLQAGQPVGTLGFPGEITALEAVPIATFKDGTISALRPYDFEEIEVSWFSSTWARLGEPAAARCSTTSASSWRCPVAASELWWLMRKASRS